MATYKEGDTEPQYHLQPSYATHKVSLEPYRRASAAIFAIFKRFAKIIQRASVDEAFLDISDQVAQTVTDMLLMDNNEVPEVRWPDGIGIMVGGHVSQSTGLHDLHLSIAASIANQIRKTVLDELGYTCSAGVAHNKTLAKICSGLNKPNKQTILRQSQVLEFMRSLPFQKIRNLGGKLGDEVS